MARTLSDQQFAELAGVRRQSVSQARREGRLVAGADGRLDPEEPVNTAYIRLHHTARGADEFAQVAALMAKTELARHAVEHLESAYVERAALVEEWVTAARQIRERLSTLPARWADPIAAELNEPKASILALLTSFAALLMEETGSFETAAAAAARRL